MSALLSLEAVSKTCVVRGREYVALSDVSLSVGRGQLVGVWDTHHVGSRTLLRLAAGLDRPDTGTVRFDGRDLAYDSTPLDTGQLRYADRRFEGGLGDTVVDHVMVPLRAVRGVSRRDARRRADAVLERVGAEACAEVDPAELHADELARVRLARALVLDPLMIVIDDPVTMIDASATDKILGLLWTITREGVAILMTVPNAEELQGVDHAHQIDDGELISSEPGPDVARVVSLPRRRAFGATS